MLWSAPLFLAATVGVGIAVQRLVTMSAGRRAVPAVAPA
ncbi:Uncharacterised protein [Mycobacteroides abscessus subsp. abscessus]|nr:Uncharacterised protein [Mycobacteroides abscessus subsp. abscessus]